VSWSGETAAAQAATGAGAIAALMLPVSRGQLEASLVGHVLVQMPLLVLAGWLFGSALAPRLDRVMEQWNRLGIAGFTFAIFTMLFWMAPRSVDGAIAHTGYEVFKFVNLPCAGVALALSFPRTLPVLAGALKAHFVSMLAVLAWLYTAAILEAIRKCWGWEWHLSPALSPSIGGLVYCLDLGATLAFVAKNDFRPRMPWRKPARIPVRRPDTHEFVPGGAADGLMQANSSFERLAEAENAEAEENGSDNRHGRELRP
jgi:hypothetical protein